MLSTGERRDPRTLEYRLLGEKSNPFSYFEALFGAPFRVGEAQPTHGRAAGQPKNATPASISKFIGKFRG